jgi:multidrug efflux pump subunit AcrA (membrane-fusion protein)
VVVGAGSAVGVAVTGEHGPSRRVATVGLASVTETVESSGTITSSLKLTPSFATSGTVKSVHVKVGDRVRKGQILATLDTTSLEASVASANASLASARQQLEADKTGQTSSSSNSPKSNIVSLLADRTTGTGDLSDLIRQVEAAQTAVTAGQRRVDTAQIAVDAAQKTVDTDVTHNTELRDAQQAACASSGGSSPTPSRSASASVNCASAMSAYEGSADTLAADVAKLDAGIASQDGYLTGLAAALDTLDKLVDQLQSAAASTSPGPTATPSSSARPTATPSDSTPSRPSGSASSRSSAPSESTPSSAPSGTTNPSEGSSTTSSQPASAAQLAADQAAIDAAAAELKSAEQNLAAATLKSPASGKVAAVGLTPGTHSSGKSITIVGTGIEGVDATVTLAQIDRVKVGQPVSVAADGLTRTLHGTVESVGLLSSTSGSSTTFPVTIRLDPDSPRRYDGSGAEVVITTGKATKVIAVPNSAIHSAAGGGHTVTVLAHGKTTTAQVTLGVAGADLTQVRSGLKVGQQVVLADLGRSLPSTSTNSTFGPPRSTNGGPGPFMHR